MARYDYKCTSCGNVFEVEHPMSETPEVVCPSCGAPASKTFSASGIKFDGSGFYNTDQRSGGSSTSATSGCCANCPHMQKEASAAMRKPPFLCTVYF